MNRIFFIALVAFGLLQASLALAIDDPSPSPSEASDTSSTENAVISPEENSAEAENPTETESSVKTDDSIEADNSDKTENSVDADNPVEVENSTETENKDTTEESSANEHETSVEKDDESTTEPSTYPDLELLPDSVKSEWESDSESDSVEKTSEPATVSCMTKLVDHLEPPAKKSFDLSVFDNTNSTTKYLIEDFFDLIYENGHIDVQIKHNDKTAEFNDDDMKRVADSIIQLANSNSDIVPFDNMKKVACDSAENFRSNVVYLTLITIFATIPDDWISDEVCDKFIAAAKKVPEELKHLIVELRKALESYNKMGNDMTDKESDVLNKINEAVYSDGKSFNFVSNHLASFKNEKILSKGCQIVDHAIDGLTKFTKPIDEYVDKFNDAMTLGQLKTINNTIVEITKQCNGFDIDEETKPDIPELKKKIEDFIDLLKKETAETPARYEGAKTILEECVTESTKTNGNKSCAEEMYMESQLFEPIKRLVEVE